jgi:hypothetical protein
MQLSDEHIQRFQRAHLAEFGTAISAERAREEFTALVEFLVWVAQLDQNERSCNDAEERRHHDDGVRH